MILNLLPKFISVMFIIILFTITLMIVKYCIFDFMILVRNTKINGLDEKRVDDLNIFRDDL